VCRDPLHSAVARVGDRWTLLIVGALLDGPKRFGELEAGVAGIAPNVLTQRLRQLEAERLVVAQAYSNRPPRYTYGLTATGASLVGALRLLAQWGAEQPGTEPVVHQACGSLVEPRWWCPTCDEMLDDVELDEVRWV